MSGADTQVQGGGDGVHIETVGGHGTLSGTVDQQAKAMGESTVMKDAEEGSNDQRVGQSWGGEARPGILPWRKGPTIPCASVGQETSSQGAVRAQ